VSSTEHPQREDTGRAGVEVPFQHAGDRASGEQIVGGMREQVAVERTPHLSARDTLHLQQLRRALQRGSVRLRRPHAGHYGRAAVTNAIPVRNTARRCPYMARGPSMYEMQGPR